MTAHPRARHRSRWAFALLLASMIVAPAVAQEVADTAATDERPFVPGGVYDRPFLTTLLGRTALGGYAEAHTRWQVVEGVRDELGFELRRWNLFTATQVSDFVRMGAEVEFEELGEEITLEYAAVDLTAHPAFNLRAGAILSPIGRFNLAHDSPRNEFTDRPLVSTEIVGTALTEPGLGAFGTLALGAGRVTYELYAVNGFHDGLITESPDGTRIPLGKKNFDDDNASPAFVGRIAWSPALAYEIGISGHHGAYNSYRIEGEQVDSRRNLTIAAFDFEGTVADVTFSGEAVSARLDLPPGLEGIYADRQHGLYVQAVREFGRGLVATMPNSFFAVGTRFDLVDFDSDLRGDSERRFSLVLDFRPTPDTVFKLDYIRGRLRDRFNTSTDEAGLLFSVATYF